MTLDEAILHAKEKSVCTKGKCSSDHAQLALWLSELKELRANQNHSVAALLDHAVDMSRKGAEKLLWFSGPFRTPHLTQAGARSLFPIQKLPDGASPIYYRDPSEETTKESV